MDTEKKEKLSDEMKSAIKDYVHECMMEMASGGKKKHDKTSKMMEAYKTGK